MIIDSSSLILIAKINRLDILENIYQSVNITEEIYKEVVESGLQIDAPDAKIIKEAEENNKIRIISLNGEYLELSKKIRDRYNLDFGESDAIALALQQKNKGIIIDEKLGRQVCKIYSLNPIGVLGIILEAYKKDIINEEELKNTLEQLIKNKFWIGARVLNEFWNIFEKIKSKK